MVPAYAGRRGEGDAKALTSARIDDTSATASLSFRRRDDR